MSFFTLDVSILTSGYRAVQQLRHPPSGSKNLLGELKVAWLMAQQIGGIAKHNIVAMATRNAAKILGWESVLGTLEPGKRADLIIVNGTSADPYDHLIQAKETDITLILINGVPRFGQNTFMSTLGAAGEALAIGGQKRTLLLKQDTQDPLVGALKLSQARATLQDAALRASQTGEGAGAAEAGGHDRP